MMMELDDIIYKEDIMNTQKYWRVSKFISIVLSLIMLFSVAPFGSLTASAASAFQNNIDIIIILDDINNPATHTSNRKNDNGYEGHTALILYNGILNKARYYSFGPSIDVGWYQMAGAAFADSGNRKDTFNGAVSVSELTGRDLSSRLSNKNGAAFWEDVYRGGKKIKSNQPSCNYERYFTFACSYAQGKKVYEYCEKVKSGTYQYDLKSNSSKFNNTNYQCDTFVYGALNNAGIKYEPKLDYAQMFAGLLSGYTAAPNDSFWLFANGNGAKHRNCGVKYVSNGELLRLPTATATRQLTANVYFRSQPSSTSKKLITQAVSKGTKVKTYDTVVDKNGDHWAVVEYKNKTGYMMAGYLKWL
jgi:hypothetical protein